MINNKIELKNILINNNTIKTADYRVFGYLSEGKYVIPPHFQPKKFVGDTQLWLLSSDEKISSFRIIAKKYSVKRYRKYTEIILSSDFEFEEYPALPLCDFFAKKFVLEIEYGNILVKTMAKFYWENLLPEIAERTFMRSKKNIRDGYILSTLNEKFYGGTYPAVDHEFHIKGRLAIAGELEKAIVKRMLQLQFKIMAEDKKGLSRNVCSVQPGGKREYEVWRYSKNRKIRAHMFRLTANIEIIEEIYNFYCLTHDKGFLKENLAALRLNCAYIEGFINSENLLCSHVYYEDQVMKDGYVLQAQAMAANGFKLMAKMEESFGEKENSVKYLDIAFKLGNSMVKSYPKGFYDKENNRFIDWIDERGQKHDHIHLLANELPELFGFSTLLQSKMARDTVLQYSEVFDKFPSFVAGRLGDYALNEIGVGGYYDLCAAGRYWCWDAEYHAFKKDGKKLLTQLIQVSNQAEKDNYLMGERYDMNYLFYNTGEDSKRNWHGASQYYEYPNVFCKVLINNYLGVKAGFEVDLEVTPNLVGNGKVELENFGIRYEINDSCFIIYNIKSEAITVQVDLSAIGGACRKIYLKDKEKCQMELTKNDKKEN